jgi:bifunctional non-homologous end joining protein LigD
MSPEEHVAGVALLHPNKIVFPSAGVTKLELARYYEAVAARMLPHVVDRPLMLYRCPDGEGQPGFYQKHVTGRVPPGLAKVTIPDPAGGPSAVYFRLKDARGLIALVQMDVVEIHVWGAVARRLERPDRVVFDLDPGAGVTWARIVTGARAVRDELARRGLTSFVKTTGGKGVHVVAPITPGPAWTEVRAFARDVAVTLARTAPRSFVAQSGAARRRGKIFIDYLRNGRGATWVAPYSVRARKGAPVSMPVSWDELTGAHKPLRWTVRSVPGMVGRDPWECMGGVRQSLRPT